MRPVPVIVLLTIVIASFGCKTGKVNVNNFSVKLDSYIFTTTPNNLDKVGYIFAVTSGNQKIPITVLNLNPIPGNIVIPKSSSTRKTTIEALLKFIGKENINAQATAGVDNKKVVNTVFEMDNTILNRAYLTLIDEQIQTNKSTIADVLIRNNLQNAKVYLIFETIEASKVIYDFDKSNIGEASLDVLFGTSATSNNNINWDNTGKGSLSYNLQQNLVVFYKALSLKIMPGVAGMNIERGEEVSKADSIYN